MQLPSAIFPNVEQEINNKLKDGLEDVELVDLLNDYSEKLRLCNQNFEKSLEYSKLAIKIAGNLQYEIGFAWALLNQASCSIYLDFSSKPCQIIEQGLKIFRRKMNVNGEIYATLILGAAKLANEDYVAAYENLQRGLNLSILFGYKKGEITGYYLLAEFSEKLEDYKVIVNYCKLALSVSDDSEVKGRIYALLGAVSLRRGDTSKAENYFLKALKRSKSIHDYFTISKAFIQLGKISLGNDDIESAKQYFKEGLELTQELGLYDRSTKYLNEIADLLIKLEDFAGASEMLREFGESAEIKTNPRCFATILLKKAMIEIKLDQPEKALQLLERVWIQVRFGDNTKLQYECHRTFSETYELTEDFARAFHHHKLFQQYKEVFDEHNLRDRTNILANRIAVEQELKIKKITDEKDVEAAQMIYEIHETIDNLNVAKERIAQLEYENLQLQSRQSVPLEVFA